MSLFAQIVFSIKSDDLKIISIRDLIKNYFQTTKIRFHIIRTYLVFLEVLFGLKAKSRIMNHECSTNMT